MELVNTMPFRVDGSVWGALLSVARIHKNVEIGQRAANMLLTLEPEKSVPMFFLLTYMHQLACGIM
ncbi:hypothetical protein PVK06_020795 [Gossypium arboreum]|uniref:Uncharacterized protein n=1 Tax=Gossypium arboreum TaxID=29729 RepID=A0ABR0PNB5_GOSAR|nr:hypothetical protein PVK06_020795 [Gossypium arboreum]